MVALASVTLVLGMVSLLLGTAVLTSLLLFLVGVSQLWRARRLGVTLTDGGIEARAASFLGAFGTWKWETISDVELKEQEYVRNPSLEVVLTTVSGEAVLLGRVTEREALVEGIRKRLRGR